MPREITFENKESIITKEVPRKNKCTAEDLNEIKEVVNENAQNLVTVSPTEPTGNNKNKVWFKKGKNQFNAYEYKYYTRNSSETYQVINSNKISVTANNGTWSRVQITILSLKPNTEYTISSEITNESQNNAAIIVTISGVEKTKTSALANTRLNVPFVTDNTGIVQIALFANWSGTEKNGTIIYDNLQLEQGSTVTSYETYVESQIFTKNNNNVYEEFKQEDVKVSSNEPIGSNAKVWFKKGKNLFDKNSALNGYYYTDGTNSIGDPNWKYIIIKVKSNTTYVASGVSSNNQSIGIAEFDSNGTVITGGFSYKNGYFTTKNTTSFLAVSCRVADLDTYMLEQGTTATSYENYIEPEIYTKNNNSVYENFITKAIVERGNNSNGRYIKYADGTMICYSKATFSVNFATANSTVQLLNPFTFPAQFAENPTVMVNTFNDADYTFATVYGTIRNSTEIAKITLYRPFAGSGAVGLGYIAIGIWR